MTPSLDDARDKLRWANEHLKTLWGQIKPFEERDTHTIRLDIDANAGEYVFYVEGLEMVDPDWGLIVGDCLHNARTSLDHLAVQLASLVTGKDSRDIESVNFPINPDPTRLTGVLSSLRKEPGFSGYWTRIQELQPFNLGNPSIWGWGGPLGPNMSPLPGALERLTSLDNIDKHRVIHAVWLGGAPLRALGLPVEAPTGFKLIAEGGGTYGRLEDSTEIGRWTFETPLPSQWRPDQMTMKRHFPTHVALGEPIPLYGVLEVLRFCLWGAGAVLDIFEPVFTRQAPPLPVTAIAPYQPQGSGLL